MSKLTLKAVKQLSADLGEPAWMLDARLQAFALYESLPFPSTQDEAWRRTNLRRFKANQITPPLTPHALEVPTKGLLVNDNSGGSAGSLTHVDGQATNYACHVPADSGVVFCDMATALREHGDLVQQYFMTEAVPATEGKFAALNAAFFRGGTFLYVPAGVSIPDPFLVSLLSGTNSFTHTLIVLEEGATATFIEQYASGNTTEGGQPFHNGVVELIVRDRANLTYVSLQDFNSRVWQFTHERARVARDAKLDWVISSMGTRLSKQFQTVELDGQGAWARMSGLFFVNGRQHFDLDTQQNHNAPDTVSDLLYKGALSDKGRSVWQGMIKALPDAQRIDGFQANRNLLLAKTARADSIPGLEIEADDVRCTHAATAGKIDETEIFYLMARGIPRATAIEMIVQGFFDPLLQRIPLETVREQISDRVLEKIR